MPSHYAELLLNYDNLIWAWKKVSRLYNQADGIVDAAEIAAFELNLEAELASIQAEFQSGLYKLTPLQILPQPKKPGSDGSQRMRESFHIAVRDQVAWTAMVNVIGPELDSRMPRWSYGHRLYKAAWYEQTQAGSRHLATGPYRHTTGHLYRKFKHSWPLFRRHVSLAARFMTAKTNSVEEEILDEADEGEKSAYAIDERPKYLSKGYWPELKDKTLFYASIDLEKFYPTIRRSAVISSLKQYLPGYLEDDWLRRLLSSLLRFTVAPDHLLLVDELKVEPRTEDGPYTAIPTGLMVAGFLSNVAMLPLDNAVEDQLKKQIKTKRRIAHMRFVDDHAVLSSNFEDLISWVRWYKQQLAKLRIGPKISSKKYDPPELSELIEHPSSEELTADVRAKCAIDGSNPAKLLTRTLALVSTLAGADFDTISEHTRHQRLDELTWLLLADLPETEIRSDTRVSFAAGRITSIVPGLQLAAENVFSALRSISDARTIRERKEAENLLDIHLQIEKAEHQKFRAKYFRLLLKAFREFPEKPRLLLQLVRYCHRTGYNGYPEIFSCLTEFASGERKGLSSYLRIIVIQAISKHILQSARIITDSGRLHRERDAAKADLSNLCSLRLDTPKNVPLLRHPLWQTSLQNLGAAYRASAELIRRHRQKLAEKLDQCADDLKTPALDDASIVWQRRTGHTIGVWTHLLALEDENIDLQPDRIWLKAAGAHNPLHVLDWNSLRKYPSHLPKNAAKYLEGVSVRLNISDGGWLWDYISQQSQKPRWLSRKAREPFISIQRHLAEITKARDKLTVEHWVKFISSLTENDPRRSEWTALQIIRKIVDSTSKFGSSLSLLDELHPSNVLLPKRWQTNGSLPTAGFWTWEGWRREMRRSQSRVYFVQSRIRDYRLTSSDSSAADSWDSRFRAIGLLLLSLLRKDCSLPSRWNTRGNERDIVRFVKRELEGIPVSSFTQAILDSALLPRSVENRLISRVPNFFFGEDEQENIRDTTTDAPVIKAPDELLSWIQKSQTALEELQISVLNHAPRQLVPMSVMQLTQTAIKLPGDDEDVG